MTINCMGGWCLLREEGCDHRPGERGQVVERICPPGQDEPSRGRIVIHRPAGTWGLKNPQLMRRPSPFEVPA